MTERELLAKAVKGIPGGQMLNTFEQQHAAKLLAKVVWHEEDLEWVRKIQKKYGFALGGPKGA